MSLLSFQLPPEWPGDPVPITIHFNENSFSMFDASSAHSPALFREPLQNLLCAVQEHFSLNNDIELTFKGLDLTISPYSLGSMNLSLAHVCSLFNTGTSDSFHIEAHAVETHNFLSRYRLLLAQCMDQDSKTNTNTVLENEEEIDLGSDSDDESNGKVGITIEEIDVGMDAEFAEAPSVPVTSEVLDLANEIRDGEISLGLTTYDLNEEGPQDGFQVDGAEIEIGQHTEGSTTCQQEEISVITGQQDEEVLLQLLPQFDEDRDLMSELELGDAADGEVFTEEIKIEDIELTEVGNTEQSELQETPIPFNNLPLEGDGVYQPEADSRQDIAPESDIYDMLMGNESTLTADQQDDLAAFFIDETESKKRAIGETDVSEDGPVPKRQKLNHGDVILV